MTLIYLTLAWIIGIVLARQLAPSPSLWAGLLGAGLLGALYGWRTRRGGLAAALVMAALLGGGRYLVAQPVIDERHVAHYNDGGWTTLRGYISAEPSTRDTYTQLEISVREIEQEDAHHAVQGLVVLNVPHYPAYEYGDVVQAAGLLETPPVLDDFSYKEYLASRGVHSLVRRAGVTRLEGTRGSALWRAVIRGKLRLRGLIEDLLPNPDAGLLSGILLGLGHTLPDDLADAFRATGLTHIIVISGFNISLVSQVIIWMSQRLMNRRRALWVSLAAIAAYAAFVGATPPVLRAALMGGLVALGQLAGRKSHGLTTLAATSLLMTASNPLLLWSVSFQLSFAATLALLLVEPVLANRLYGWMAGWVGMDRAKANLRLLRDVLLVTAAAQLITLPIIWYHFAQVSLISPLANLLVTPAQPAIMILGVAMLALGGIAPPLGKIAAWLVWPLLRYSILVIQWLGGLSWAAVEVPRVGPVVVAAFYVVLALALLMDRERVRAAVRTLLARPKMQGAWLGGLGLAVVLVWVAAFSLPDGRLHVYFLDVGQGDAILLRTPGGRTVLVDGGPDPLQLTSRLGQILPFWQRRVDLVVATHGDSDHLAGLIPVLERYRVGQVIASPITAENGLTTRWQELLETKAIPVLLASRDTRIQLGSGVELDVLSPPARIAHEAEADDNRQSLVLGVTTGQARVLLTADIDAETERELLAAGAPLRATVLKVAHHGASTASSEEFLAAVNPQIAVISVGRGNRFGHPTDETLGRLTDVGCQVWRTDESGTIEWITDGRACWLKSRRNGR